MKKKLNIFLTVDVEVSPSLCKKVGFDEAFNRCIYGTTAEGGYGLPYQLKTLNDNNLKATFFVEPLFSLNGRTDYLKKIVDLILLAEQGLGLHLHTEWLKILEIPILPKDGCSGGNMADYSEVDQNKIISLGLECFKRCSVEDITSFRAGNYGADFNTLTALAKNGIEFDSSYNFTYLKQDCSLNTKQMLIQPTEINNIHEIPISFFQQYPGSYRHLQIVACSSAEMQSLMRKAWNRGWYSFVIVSHSFELFHRDSMKPNDTAIRRFGKLCLDIGGNSHMFSAKAFSEIDINEIDSSTETKVLKSSIFLTALRYVEQLKKRIVK